MFIQKRHSLALFAAFISLLSLWFLGGCDSKSRLDAPSTTTSSISITASPAAVELNATSVVEATYTVDETPVAGETVLFTVQPSTAGYFTPTSAVTDADGIAASVYTATSEGSAILSATLESNSDQTASTSVDVSSTQQSGDGNVNIQVTPNLLLANGIDSAIVSIVVRDGLGQLVPDSTLVRVTAGEKFVDVDGNGYWSPGTDSLVFDANANGMWDAIGVISSSARTVDGSATVVFHSGNDAQTVYIKVSVNEGGITGEAEVSLQLSPDATPDFIYLLSDSVQLSVAQTGGIEVATLYATVYDVNANPVPEGITVNFYILDGPGGGEHLGTVDQGPYEATTNSQGVATATIHSGSIPGTIRIRAAADGVLSNATQILVSAGPPAYIVVGAEECNVPYWDDVNGRNNIVAVVSDIYLNPVNDSTVVYFSTDEGTMKSHEERTGDHEGVAETVWISGTQVSGADGIVWVYAETAGGTVRCSTYFFDSHYPSTLFISGLPASMPADGRSKAYVTVSAVDLNGNPVISGTQFQAIAYSDMLSVLGGTFENGCWGASADVTVTTRVLEEDYSVTGGDDDGIGGVETVEFWHEAGASISQTVNITTGFAYSGNSALRASTNPGAGETTQMIVTIKDRPGNPLADHTILLPDNSTIETNNYGEAYFMYTAPTTPGDYVVSVVDQDPRGNGLTLSVTIVVQ